MNTNRNNIAKLLLENKIIELSPQNPFTFSSGIKSPIYCDGRKIISNLSLRKTIAKALADQVKAKYPDVEIICGVATGSIAMAAWVSEILDLPMIYYRKPKGYGHNNTVEGEFTAGQKAVIIEDTVSTGTSCLNAVTSVRESGLNVLGAAFIYSHRFDSSIQNFADCKCEYIELCDIVDVLAVAKESQILDESESKMVLDWKNNPKQWGINAFLA